MQSFKLFQKIQSKQRNINAAKETNEACNKISVIAFLSILHHEDQIFDSNAQLWLDISSQNYNLKLSNKIHSNHDLVTRNLARYHTTFSAKTKTAVALFASHQLELNIRILVWANMWTYELNNQFQIAIQKNNKKKTQHRQETFTVVLHKLNEQARKSFLCKC